MLPWPDLVAQRVWHGPSCRVSEKRGLSKVTEESVGSLARRVCWALSQLLNCSGSGCTTQQVPVSTLKKREIAVIISIEIIRLYSSQKILQVGVNMTFIQKAEG